MSQYQSPFGSGNISGPFGGGLGITGGGPWGNMRGSSDMYNFMQEWNNQTPEQRAKQQGYHPDPRNPGQFTTIGEGPHYTAGAGKFGPPPAGAGQFQFGALRDFWETQQAQGKNWQRADDAHTAFLETIEGEADRMELAGQASEDKMFGFAEGLTDETWGRVEDRLAGFDKITGDFKDSSKLIASSKQRAIQKRMESQASQYMAGAMAGDPEHTANLQMMRAEANALSASTAANSFKSYEEANAQLGMASEQGKTQALGVGIAGEQIASAMRTRGIELKTMASAKASEARIGGRAKYADMIEGNPYTPVSFLASLTAYFQFLQTPGASEFTGFNPEMMDLAMGQTAMA